MLCVRAILCRRLATTSAPFVGALRGSNEFEPLQQALGRAEVASLAKLSTDTWKSHTLSTKVPSSDELIPSNA